MNVFSLTNILSFRASCPWKRTIKYISEHYMQDIASFRRQICAETQL